jgi:hypothetical protein
VCNKELTEGDVFARTAQITAHLVTPLHRNHKLESADKEKKKKKY